MNIKKIAKAAVTLLYTAALCFFSCKKKEKGIFYIKGQLMDSCNGNPIAEEKLIVSFLYKGSWVTASKSIDSAGGAITDANGNFYIACNDEGSGNYRIVSEQKRTYVSLGLDKENGDIIDLGNVYRYSIKYFATLNVTIKGTFGINDTLYVEGKYHHPVIGGTSYHENVQYTVSNPDYESYSKSKSRPTSGFWAIGKNTYDSLVKSYSTKNKFTFIFSLCDTPGQITEVLVEK